MALRMKAIPGDTHEVLDAPLEAMPPLTVQRSGTMIGGFNVANPFGWLILGKPVLFRPGKETAECGQAPIDCRWRKGWNLFLEIFPIVTDISWHDFGNIERFKGQAVPVEKMGKIRQICNRRVPAGIFRIEILFERFEQDETVMLVDFGHGKKTFLVCIR
jgi:hypothetical protein